MARGVPFGCGQCLPCRINRRRQWMWRQYLESLCHEENSFVTLTYSDKHLPNGGSLSTEDVRLWLYRFRQACRPFRVRYFLVGEYGEETGRPHYHLSLFGLSGDTVVASASGAVRVAEVVAQTWGKGLVHVAEFNELTAQYVAGYVTKKMTSVGDPRLKGRVPEFARQSRRPGLGAGAMKLVADAWIAACRNGPPPSELRIGRRKIPLGRYMLQKLREAVGLSEDEIRNLKSEVSYESSVEMSVLLADAIAAAPYSPVNAKDVYLEEVKQKILQVESRYKLYKKRGVI